MLSAPRYAVRLALLLLTASTGLRAEPIQATLVAFGNQQAKWLLPEAPQWAPPAHLRAPERGLDVVVTEIRRRYAISQVVHWPEDLVRVGDRFLLEVSEGDGVAAAEPAPVAESVSATGLVTRVEGDTVWANTPLPPRPDGAAQVQREADPVAGLTWLEPAPASGQVAARWQALTPGAAPQVGDVVQYVAAAAVPVIAVPPPSPPRVARPLGEETVIPGDDPLYDRLGYLAAHGCVAHSSRRQFDGDLETVYTRGQVADLLAATCDQLLDRENVWPVQDAPGRVATELLRLIDLFATELEARGVDLARARAELAPSARPGLSWYTTGLADVRLISGGDAFDGKAEASLLGSTGGRLRFGLTLGTEGLEPLPDERDRTSLMAYYVDWDLSHHANLGVGRLATRQGPGIHDLLWSDRAKPMDQLYFSAHTKVFGRPFQMWQRTGYFHDANTDKFVAVRRYEYLPTRRLTLAASFGLVTDKAGQAAASLVMPLYAVRFVAGKSAAGGAGNFLGSADVSYRLNRSWAVYGQFFADDFDFSPSPPKTVQRIGWLGGIHFTPQSALPGSSFRLEAAVLPDPGTYTGQLQPRLAWLHGNYILGHEYGADSFGVVFEGRQRLTSQLDVALRIEDFKQLRSTPAPPRTSRVDLSAGYDFTDRLGLKLGFLHRRHNNQGGVFGNNQTEDGLFFELRAGY